MLNSRAKNKTVRYALLFAIAISLAAHILLSAVSSFYDYETNKYLFYNIYFLALFIAVYFIVLGINKHFLIVAFFVCFFIFLLGQKLFVVADGGAYDAFLTFAYLKLTPREYVTFANVVYYSILCCFVGYLIGKKNKHKIKAVNQNADRTGYLLRMRKIIRILYWAFFICTLVMQLQILKAKSGLNYTDGYLINVDVNPLLKIGNYLYLGTAFAFLSCRPSKKETAVIILSFGFVEGFLQMLLGRRALIAQFVLFVIWYLFVTTGFDKKKFKFKYVLTLAAFGLFMIGVFYVVEVIRGGGKFELGSFSDIIKKFFISTGGSDSTIGNTIHYAEDFPKFGIVYLLSPIKTALFDNVLIRSVLGLLTGVSVISPAQGLGYLQRYDSFDHWLSYIVNPDLYIKGYGMGSSYIAEVYFAFGIIGIVIFGLLLGIFIAKLSSFDAKSSKIYTKAYILFFAYYLFTLPRSGAFSWATQLLYFTAALAVIKVIATVISVKEPCAYKYRKHERIS